MLFTLTLLGVAFALAYNYYQKTYTYWARRGVPHETPLPLIGNMKGVGMNYHFRDINQRIYDKFKGKAPIAGMFMFFKRTALILDLDLIKQVLIKDFHYFNNTRDPDPLTLHLLTLEGEEWKPMRLTRLFSSDRIRQMSGVVVELGHHLVYAMDKSVKAASIDDGDVEIKELCARFTTDVSGSCAFGLECHSLKDPNAEFRNKGRMIFENPRHSMLVQAFIFTNEKLARRFRMKFLPDELKKFFMDAVKSTVEYRLKNGIKRNDFVGQLIELRAEDQEAARKAKGIDLSKGLPLEEIAAQSFLFFIAGFEASSITMGFCLYELALQPEIQQRVREEIESVLSNVEGGEITYDALAEMTYLEQVVAETLRKRPIMAQLLCETNESYKVPNTDFVIEKGTTIMIPVHNIHHDADIYPDPEKFDPSRFEPEEIKARHPFAYLPFGDGPLRFGNLQAKIGIVSLLRHFKFSISKKTEIPLELDPRTFTLSAKHGIHLKVERI